MPRTKAARLELRITTELEQRLNMAVTRSTEDKTEWVEGAIRMRLEGEEAAPQGSPVTAVSPPGEQP